VKAKGAQWEEGIFENDYIKQDGIWKIHSVHYYPRVITDYELGWAERRKAGRETQYRVAAGPPIDGSLRNISEDVLPAIPLREPGDSFARSISFRHRLDS
jgi:hypothetical protein